MGNLKNRSEAKPEASVQPITSVKIDHEALEHACKTKAASKLNLNNLSLDERAFLGTCQNIYRSNIGCYTPFECFFDDLVRWTMWETPPTPDSIRAQMEDAGNNEFFANWSQMLHGVKRFVQNYPDLITEFQNDAKGEVEQPAEAVNA